MRIKPFLLTIVCLVFSPSQNADAADLGVLSKKLIVKTSGTGKSKVVYLANDQTSGITMGAGSEDDQIHVQFDFKYGNGSTRGAFTIPPGANDTTEGWRVVASKIAKFKNKNAPNGATGAKTAIVKPDKLLKLAAKDSGDTPIDILGAGDPAGSVYTSYCVVNGTEVACHCSEFTNCKWSTTGGGAGAKLVCKDGQPDPQCLAKLPSCSDAVLSDGEIDAAVTEASLGLAAPFDDDTEFIILMRRIEQLLECSILGDGSQASGQAAAPRGTAVLDCGDGASCLIENMSSCMRDAFREHDECYVGLCFYGAGCKFRNGVWESVASCDTDFLQQGSNCKDSNDPESLQWSIDRIVYASVLEQGRQDAPESCANEPCTSFPVGSLVWGSCNPGNGMCDLLCPIPGVGPDGNREYFTAPPDPGSCDLGGIWRLYYQDEDGDWLLSSIYMRLMQDEFGCVSGSAWHSNIITVNLFSIGGTYGYGNNISLEFEDISGNTNYGEWRSLFTVNGGCDRITGDWVPGDDGVNYFLRD